MVKKILEKAGFIINKTYKESRFLKAPKSTYCIFKDSFEARGADYHNMIKDHSYTIEMYSYTPDPAKEKAIEDSLDFYGFAYSKEERYWIESEQLYQVIYGFDFIEK